jgi:F0F1-type ATP synthase membrane subunit b/b'
MHKEPGKNENEKDEQELDDLREDIRYELDNIRDDLMDELEELHEDFEDDIDNLRDAKDEVKEDLRDALEDLKDERAYLLREIGETTEGLDDLGEDAREQIERAREKLELIKIKTEEQREKYEDKMRKKLEKAQRKAEKKTSKRINISVDSETSDEWRDWSDELGSSVSELIRKSMKFVKNNIGDFKKLEEWGESIERAVKESGIEELGEEMEKKYGEKYGKRFKIDLKTNQKPKIRVNHAPKNDKERIKKRVRGLIKLQKSLPIDKLARALNKTNEDAENLIYELVDEGIEGSLEEGIFKFTSSPDDVISKINDLIDKM